MHYTTPEFFCLRPQISPCPFFLSSHNLCENKFSVELNEMMQARRVTTKSNSMIWSGLFAYLGFMPCQEFCPPFHQPLRYYSMEIMNTVFIKLHMKEVVSPFLYLLVSIVIGPLRSFLNLLCVLLNYNACLRVRRLKMNVIIHLIDPAVNFIFCPPPLFFFQRQMTIKTTFGNCSSLFCSVLKS